MGYPKYRLCHHKSQEKEREKLATPSFMLAQQSHGPPYAFSEKGSQRPAHASGVPMSPSDESPETGSVCWSGTVSARLIMTRVRTARCDVEKFPSPPGHRACVTARSSLGSECFRWESTFLKKRRQLCITEPNKE